MVIEQSTTSSFTRKMNFMDTHAHTQDVYVGHVGTSGGYNLKIYNFFLYFVYTFYTFLSQDPEPERHTDPELPHIITIQTFFQKYGFPFPALFFVVSLLSLLPFIDLLISLGRFNS